LVSGRAMQAKASVGRVSLLTGFQHGIGHSI
jgi:hypothetical protein